jgi:hypothetical protein
VSAHRDCPPYGTAMRTVRVTDCALSDRDPPEIEKFGLPKLF